MGLLNKRTIDTAKRLALQNKDKIADGVGKATDVIDRKTGGKHRDTLKKVDDAAAKFAGRVPADDADGTAGDETVGDDPADTAEGTSDRAGDRS